jgi:hypothetical protein
VTEYLLELYVPGNDLDLAAAEGRSVRAAADELTGQGTRVLYRRSMFVSTEETYFVVLEADSLDAVRATARLAEVSCARVSAVLSDPAPSEHKDS